VPTGCQQQDKRIEIEAASKPLDKDRKGGWVRSKKREASALYEGIENG
jgi:hypothetical protein